ncbi:MULTISPECIES: TetR/AcrR family transcriptional regulator [Streptomyces]|uniref:AcrR family transcriptional regulator n=1 Tax=Streptomyces clavifer TaxID=68188 RepID=A0ABS4VIG1_9ACTN|nr:MULTISPECIES: TetR/AcrR family transcriptional regulator [Streptomyces]MBP2363703.1 AcrR family transcriptional regulator [Streptomyces clavifer]MDX2747322.1 helix-turn-helix domain containing protein [Streptomyces sp. NRRL_B-2557]MDX3065911.1 helix-turn-helix domain containing protein [Streptomyces sp. ND04-05B]WRY86115.1 TetR/AcrR family transcriptional regulator [Streptomyces clavifer]WUC31827.1 TetR/AcrR family transcriptional regulator [Streptomyces clavifer]
MTQPHMPAERRPANHGPKVAARNRDALIVAAREIYAAHGLDAPLSAIARRAGVGQGVLYRHFPDRASVAIAVLEENVRQVEQAAATEGFALTDVLGVLTWHLTESAAFLGLLHAHGAAGHSDALAHALALSGRVECALRQRLPEEHPLSAANDLMLAVAMVSGAVSGPTREVREHRAAAAWRLLGVPVGPVRPFKE